MKVVNNFLRTFHARLRCGSRWTVAPRSSDCEGYDHESFACSFGFATKVRMLLFRAASAMSPLPPPPPHGAPTPALRPSERNHDRSSRAVAPLSIFLMGKCASLNTTLEKHSSTKHLNHTLCRRGTRASPQDRSLLVEYSCASHLTATYTFKTQSDVCRYPCAQQDS